MISETCFDRSAGMERRSFAAQPVYRFSFTERATMAASAGRISVASPRENLYMVPAKKEQTWMEGFLKDLAAVRTVRASCSARPARRGLAGSGAERCAPNSRQLAGLASRRSQSLCAPPMQLPPLCARVSDPAICQRE